MNKQSFALCSRKGLMAAGLSVAALLSSCAKDEIQSQVSQQMPEATAASAPSDIVPNQYIVLLKQNNTGPVTDPTHPSAESLKIRISELLDANGLNSATPAADRMFTAGSLGFVADVTPDQAKKLAQDPNVELVEPVQKMTIGYGFWKKTFEGAYFGTQATVQSPSSNQVTPVGIKRVGGAGDGRGRTAWIVDSGIDFDHPDLTVDTRRSRSFTDASAGGNYTSADDEFGHGTMVAGIIAAKNNTYGVVGVASGATVVSVKVMDTKGNGNSGWLVNGLNYIYQNGKPGEVVNLSLGGGASAAVDRAVQALAAKGMIVTIAAGNEKVDCSNTSPARVNGTRIYTVSAMDGSDVFSSYSNYGAPVDYCLPGNNVFSTKVGGGYGSASGTSFAAPHLAGIMLMGGGRARTSGYVKNDPDGKADPIGVR